VGQRTLPIFFFLFFLNFPIQHRGITDHSGVPPLALPGQTALIAFTSTGSTLPCRRHSVVILPPGDKPTPQVLACWPSLLMPTLLVPFATVTAEKTAAPAVTAMLATPTAMTVILATGSLLLPLDLLC
jgi:hypothetical protein